MQGSINFDGTLSGSIAGSGGGSEVSITPTLQSGTKIADYTIDETTGSLYAPTPEPPTELPANIVTKVQRKYNDTTQTLIATVTTLDTESEASVSQDIFAPSPPIVNYIEEPGLSEDIQIGSLQVGGNSTPIYIPSSGAETDYSLTEQNTGRKWIDGKDIYQLTISIPTYSSSDFIISLSDYNIDQVVDLVSTARSYYTYDGGIHWDDRRFIGNYVTQGSGYNLIYRIEGDHDNPLSLRCIAQSFPITRLSSYHTLYYTKNV